MSDTLIPVPDAWKTRAFVTPEKYEAWYLTSVADANGFWGQEGRKLDWIKPFTKVKNTSFRLEDFRIKWFEDGTLNVSANCIDRHLTLNANRTAIIWEGDDPAQSRHKIGRAHV